ncbi:hypothetical protein BH23CHL7_BH23CHL7_15300 [soil metagenome]
MRIVRAILIALISAVAASGAAYFLVVRPRLRDWGIDPVEAELPLPGDDLVPDPTAVETRGIAIDAPPSAIWPWLVQMGYERAGWYSYDALDNKGASVDQIMPEFQHIAVGEVMPTHPGGGFLVKVVEPEHALVLYTDTALVREQAGKAEAEGTDELATPGLKASGAMLNASFPEFAASWAFFLRPTDDGQTRLVERFRAQTPGSGPARAVLGEIMGTGIVLMTRKQLLGIKARVEGTLGKQRQPATDEQAFANEIEAIGV